MNKLVKIQGTVSNLESSVELMGVLATDLSELAARGGYFFKYSCLA